MDKSKIIEKIKKCLALSKSSNQHEAAAALRQAQKLMRLYNIEQDEMDSHGISEQVGLGSQNNQPPDYECYLAANIAELFACKVIYITNPNDPPNRWSFMGIHPANELAQYAFDVVYRQLMKSRADYIKTKLKRCKTRTTKTRRADLYCNAWVSAVRETIKQLVVKDEAHEERLQKYLIQTYPDQCVMDGLERNKGNSFTESDWRSYLEGKKAGAEVEINQGVGGGKGGGRKLLV